MLESLQNFFQASLFQTEGWVLGKDLIQIALLLGGLLLVYTRLIRKTQAEALVKGLLICALGIVSLWGLSHTLNLPILETVFGISIQLLIIGLIVIFQPELRRILLYLGQPDRLGKPLGTILWENPLVKRPVEKPETALQELVEAIRYLSKSKTGALIVLERDESDPLQVSANYLEAGTALDAQLSTELLLTLFHPKTPLHDGAVVITPCFRLSAAGVLLPLTEDPTLSWQYGTRHRAAIGLTEVSHSLAIVVSEETGNISLASNGRLERMANTEDLRKRLESVYIGAGWSQTANATDLSTSSLIRTPQITGVTDLSGFSPVILGDPKRKSPLVEIVMKEGTIKVIPSASKGFSGWVQSVSKKLGAEGIILQTFRKSGLGKF